MKQKRSLRYAMLVAYFRVKKNPTRAEVFAINYIRDKYIWAFIR